VDINLTIRQPVPGRRILVLRFVPGRHQLVLTFVPGRHRLVQRFVLGRHVFVQTFTQNFQIFLILRVKMNFFEIFLKTDILSYKTTAPPLWKIHYFAIFIYSL
jgi:hypothetical protein